jgi:hypothetical protein
MHLQIYYVPSHMYVFVLLFDQISSATWQGQGPSMAPTISPLGQLLFVDCLSARLHRIKPGKMKMLSELH